MRLDVQKLRGELVVRNGTMNSNKTSDLILTSNSLVYSPYSFMVFANSRNSRDGSKMMTVTGLRQDEVYVADAENPGEILKLINAREKNIKGNVDVIIFDESNLHTPRFIPVVQELRKNGKLVVVYGLDKDFRGEPFGPMGRLEVIAREREKATGHKLVETGNAWCTALQDTERCGNLATYNLRAVRLNGRDSEEVRFIDIDGKTGINGFTRAKYYDPTIVIEGSSSLVKYTTVCEEHFGELPGKEAVIKILEDIRTESKIEYHKLIKNYGEEAVDILAYGIEEFKIDIEGGVYEPRRKKYPIPSDVNTLAAISKRRDNDIDTTTTINIYDKIRSNGRINRMDLQEEFKNVRGIERILGDLTKRGLISLKDAYVSRTPYILDESSGMYVPNRKIA